MTKAIFMGEKSLEHYYGIYREDVRGKLAKKLDMPPYIVNREMLLAKKDEFIDVEYIFSSWGMSVLSEEEIKNYLPNVKAVFYAAGSVQKFAKPFLDSGVKVFSAWAANAVPVTEYTIAQILLANKGFYLMGQMMKNGLRSEAPEFGEKFYGNFGANIGILGAGMIGKMVIEKLKLFDLNIKVFDPFLDTKVAENMGVKLCSLEDIFSTCNVISNHIANNKDTLNIISKDIINLMPSYTTFINTGRGAQVDEAALVEKLSIDPTITAILDVTDPEPPVKGHPFYTMNNVLLTPHIAGSHSNEVARMGEYMCSEFEALIDGFATKYEVSLAMLKTMA